jgi:CysZ protein
MKAVHTSSNAVKQFLLGAIYFLRGMKLFYTKPRYWSYAIVPMILSIVLYVLGFWAFFYFVQPHIMNLLPEPAQYSEWIRWLIYPLRWLVYLSSIILGLTIFLMTFTGVYFMLSAPFFDNMTVKMEELQYNFKFQPAIGKEMLSYWITSIFNGTLLAIKTIIWSVILFPFTFLIPYGGMLVFILVVGYLMALSFLLYSAEHRRLNGKDLKEALKGNRIAILGFGVITYLALFIPFAAIVLLPGAVAGGVILFNEQIDIKSKSFAAENTPALDA